MSKKARYKIKTTTTKKNALVSFLKPFEVRQISYQRNKRGDVFVLFSVKSDSKEQKNLIEVFKNELQEVTCS
jgi:hypothetical protein